MISQSPYELPAVLFVDDEPKTCKHFTRLFAPRFRIITESDGIEAMKLFKEQVDDIGIIMTDQRMPNETGTEFLEKASRIKPSVKRILSTAYADVDAAVDAVNNGGIYRYITKPWEVAELEMTLIRAMELYLLEKDRQSLLSKNLEELTQLAIRERVHGLAALSVFKDSEVRHLARAIGTLIQLGNPGTESLDQQQWAAIYESNRNFLDSTRSALADHSFSSGDLDHKNEVSVRKLLGSLDLSGSSFEIVLADETAPALPGPLDSLAGHLTSLLQELGAALSEEQTLTLQETKEGLTLTFPADPIEKALHPLFHANSNSTAGPCLKLALAVISWHHHGGQLDLSREKDTLTATLRIQPAQSSPDPWQDLAADLIANASFWKRQI